MRERTPLTRAILEQLPNLKLIASTARRNASIDLVAASERGVTVCKTGYTSHGAIELTWALILALLRRCQEACPGRVVDAGVFRVPYPVETRLSLVDLDDVAAAAAVVLTQDGHHGATYELVGTKPLNQSEVAAAIGAALGRNVRAEAEPLAAWDARARAGGMGEYERATLAAMLRYYADHGLVGNPHTLRWLLGRAPNDLAAFLRRVAAQPQS